MEVIRSEMMLRILHTRLIFFLISASGLNIRRTLMFRFRHHTQFYKIFKFVTLEFEFFWDFTIELAQWRDESISLYVRLI